MSVLNKSRTFIPNVPGMITYHNDGKGRDTYISMDNGAFWKRPVFMPKEESTNRHITKLPDLSSYKPLNRYYQDGQGRDFYIAKAINKDWVNTSAVISSNLFRDNNNVINSNPLRLKKKGYSKFEKRLLDRIFYGKTEGLNERYMSPKVKFGVKRKKPEYDCFGNLLNGEDEEEEYENLKTAPNKINEDEKKEEGENEEEKNKEEDEEEKYEDNWKYKYTHYDDFPQEDVMLKKVRNCFNFEDKDYKRQNLKRKYPWVY
jgi:hypothetical protein